MAERRLNCEGLNCPMPIVEMSKAARAMASGDILEVTATDQAFRLDVEAWARKLGHTLESFNEGNVQVARFRIK
ncbi:MAG: sulfurtransferase TusA family protein [Planctomycetaceae bacterium]